MVVCQFKKDNEKCKRKAVTNYPIDDKNYCNEHLQYVRNPDDES